MGSCGPQRRQQGTREHKAAAGRTPRSGLPHFPSTGSSAAGESELHPQQGWGLQGHT